MIFDNFAISYSCILTHTNKSRDTKMDVQDKIVNKICEEIFSFCNKIPHNNFFEQREKIKTIIETDIKQTIKLNSINNAIKVNNIKIKLVNKPKYNINSLKSEFTNDRLKLKNLITIENENKKNIEIISRNNLTDIPEIKKEVKNYLFEIINTSNFNKNFIEKLFQFVGVISIRDISNIAEEILEGEKLKLFFSVEEAIIRNITASENLKVITKKIFDLDRLLILKHIASCTRTLLDSVKETPVSLEKIEFLHKHLKNHLTCADMAFDVRSNETDDNYSNFYHACLDFYKDLTICHPLLFFKSLENFDTKELQALPELLFERGMLSLEIANSEEVEEKNLEVLVCLAWNDLKKCKWSKRKLNEQNYKRLISICESEKLKKPLIKCLKETKPLYLKKYPVLLAEKNLHELENHAELTISSLNSLAKTVVKEMSSVDSVQLSDHQLMRLNIFLKKLGEGLDKIDLESSEAKDLERIQESLSRAFNCPIHYQIDFSEAEKNDQSTSEAYEFYPFLEPLLRAASWEEFQDILKEDSNQNDLIEACRNFTQLDGLISDKSNTLRNLHKKAVLKKEDEEVESWFEQGWLNQSWVDNFIEMKNSYDNVHMLPSYIIWPELAKKFPQLKKFVESKSNKK